MNPTMYLDELISEIKWEDRDDYDRLIHVADAFYQIGLIKDQEFLTVVNFLIAELKRFGITEEGVKELFALVPEI